MEVLDDTSLLNDKRGVGENAGDTVTSTSSIVLNNRVMAKDWHILQQNIKRGVHWSTGGCGPLCILTIGKSLLDLESSSYMF